jgi:FAD/FMN-containing dehydrogenase
MVSWKTELQNAIKGQVLSDDNTRDHYSSDGSLFVIRPQAVVLPKDEDDLKKLVLFVRKHNHNKLSITCRGKGTDLTGGAVNNGIILRFSGHLDAMLAKGEDFVQVQPGLVYGEMNKQLADLGVWLPVSPASGAFCSVGGMVSNNSGGIKSIKYGETRDYVRSLRVILSDGSEIETKPLDDEQLAKKLELKTLEGELYRGVKKIVEENKDIIQQAIPHVTKNSSGYQLWSVMPRLFHSTINIERDYAFDLTQLFVGSQGTLGIVKDITFRTVPRAAEDGVLVGYIEDLHKAGEAVQALIPFNPSGLEMVDRHIIEIIDREQPELTKDLPMPRPALVLFCEFEGANEEEVRAQIEKARPVLAQFSVQEDFAIHPPKEDFLWTLRRKSAAVIEHMQGDTRAVPLEFDGAVPSGELVRFVDDVYALFQQYGFQFAVWGHAGDGNLHIRPIITITEEKQRASLKDLARDMYALFAKYHGTASGEHGDGLMATPFLASTYGVEMVQLFEKVKNIFDPRNMFNPMKKVGATSKVYQEYMRKDFSGYYQKKDGN